MTGPCDDLRIIDLTSGQAGGIATMILADFGADVIKVEPPGGDPSRAPARRTDVAARQAQRHPRPRHGRGPRDTARLAQGADVVVTSYGPGNASRRGADYETLSQDNPGLVYCSITGWGPQGPLADYPADEQLVAAKTGRMWAFQNVARRAGPGFPAVQVGTHGASQSAVAGILAALHAREATGVGQLVETSLLQGMFPFDLNTLIREQLLARHPELAQNDMWTRYLSPDMMPTLGYHPLVTSDGRWIQLANLLEHLFQSSIVALDLDRGGAREPALRRRPERPRRRGARGGAQPDAVARPRAHRRRVDGGLPRERQRRGRPRRQRAAGALPRRPDRQRRGRSRSRTRTSARCARSDRSRSCARRRRRSCAAHPMSVSTPPRYSPKRRGHAPRQARERHQRDTRAPLEGVTVLEFATIIATPLGALAARRPRRARDQDRADRRRRPDARHGRHGHHRAHERLEDDREQGEHLHRPQVRGGPRDRAQAPRGRRCDRAQLPPRRPRAPRHRLRAGLRDQARTSSG